MDILQKRLLLKSKKQNGPTLPSVYQRVEYIEATGTQFIDSGYLSDSDYAPYKIRLDFQNMNTTTATSILGATASISNFYPLLFETDISRNAWVFGHFGNSSTIRSSARFGELDTERHIFEYIFQNGVYLDGVLYEETVEQACISSIPNCNLGIFTRIRGGVADNTRYASARLFDLEFYGKDGIERKYVPCYHKETAEVGLFELYTQQFLTNRGTGKFVYGEL